jgi:hypothetical protein
MERGWGRSHWGNSNFETLAAALAFQKAENAKNNLPSVPDWYVIADEPRLVDLDLDGPPR